MRAHVRGSSLVMHARCAFSSLPWLMLVQHKRVFLALFSQCDGGVDGPDLSISLFHPLEPGAGASSKSVQLTMQPRTGWLFPNQSWLETTSSCHCIRLCFPRDNNGALCVSIAVDSGLFYWRPSLASDLRDFNVDCLCLYFHKIMKV